MGEAIQQPSPIAESSLTENDEENPLEAPASGETADAAAQVADPSYETESPDGDVTTDNVENRETESESGDLTSPTSGQNNEAFEPEENVVIENETNAVVVKRNYLILDKLVLNQNFQKTVKKIVNPKFYQECKHQMRKKVTTKLQRDSPKVIL